VIGLWPGVFLSLRCSVTRWRSRPALLVREDTGGRSRAWRGRDHKLIVAA